MRLDKQNLKGADLTAAAFVLLEAGLIVLIDGQGAKSEEIRNRLAEDDFIVIHPPLADVARAHTRDLVLPQKDQMLSETVEGIVRELQL